MAARRIDRSCRIRRASGQAGFATGGRDFARIVDRHLCPAVTSGSGTLRRVGGERRATSIDSITLGDGGHQGERSPRLGRLHAGSTHQRHGDARPQAGKPPAGGAFSGLR
jgi:hypothetical protein